jgi:hypothetical protein
MRIFGVLPALAILILCLANPAEAGLGGSNSLPVCPTVEQIQAVAAIESIDVRNNAEDYYNYHLNNNVRGTWVFFMDFEASSLQDAQTKAQNAIKTLVFEGGPWKETENAYICKYNTSDGLVAKTMTWYYGKMDNSMSYCKYHHRC